MTSYNEYAKSLENKKLRSSINVLLVDDQAESLVPLNFILQNLGIYPQLAFDGFAAKRLLMGAEFDFVVLDWNMPEINGGQCLDFTDTALYLLGSHRRAVPFVTYSATPLTSLNIPETVFFKHVGHWAKPFTVLNLTKQILETIRSLNLS